MSPFPTEECGCCGLAKQLTQVSDGLASISANPLLDTKVDPMQVEISEDNANNAWCSAIPTGATAYYPYLTFKFTSTYLIELVKISGSYSPNTYVIAVTIQNDTGQGFEFISDNQSGVPKVSQFRYSAIVLHILNQNLIILNMLEGISDKFNARW